MKRIRERLLVRIDPARRGRGSEVATSSPPSQGIEKALDSSVGSTSSGHLSDASDCLHLLQERAAARAAARRFPPATDEQIQTAEVSLNFPLPAFLCRVYTTIANGGFGPGRGLIGVRGGAADEHGNSIVDLYDSFSALNPEDHSWQWPDRLVPVCHWVESVYSCVDCAAPEGTVICLDLTGYEPGRDLKDFLIPQRQVTVEAWLRAWAEGIDLWTEMFSLELA